LQLAWKANQAALGDRFAPRVADSAANPDAPTKNPHRVVRAHLIEREGEPTVAARDEIRGFFKMRLREPQLTPNG
jgi:hypothetical protein